MTRADEVSELTTLPQTSPVSSAPILLQISRLKKSYELKPTLRGIDLTLHQGERMALLGANGAGKTTLLRIIACLTKPGSGAVTVAGLDCEQDAQEIRALIGLVAHDPYLYEELTALENLLFFARLYDVPHGRQRAVELLRRVGLERRQRDRVSTFSRGMLQRLAWGRALLHSPRLLLLDEPETGLDQEGHELIDTLLTEHTSRGGTTLFTTHSLERALQLSDKVVLLSAGRVVYQQESAPLNRERLRAVYQREVR